MSESSNERLVGVAIPTLRELRAALLKSSDPESAVYALRDAGYTGGEAVHAAFEQWLAESGKGAAEDLPMTEFSSMAAEFFRNAGWGDITFSHDEAEGIAILEMENCWEADEHGCQITTGMLASFFGRVAGYPISVMETECTDDGHCQFMLGNADTMQYRWEMMSA